MLIMFSCWLEQWKFQNCNIYVIIKWKIYSDYNKIKVFREYKYGRLESNDDNFEEQNDRKNSLRDTLIDTNDISTC
jgi:hypothetical protein